MPKPHETDMSNPYPQHHRHRALRRGYTSSSAAECYEKRGSETLAITSARRLCSDGSLLLAATLLASNGRVDVVIEVITVFVAVTLVLRSRDPETRLPVVEGLVLAGQIDTITAAGSIASALGQSAGALRQLGGDGGVLGDPVGESVFAVLDDTVAC